MNVHGNREGYRDKYDDGAGIYLDDDIHDVIVKYNMVHACSRGILLHINGRNYVENNQISDCLIGMLTAREIEDNYWYNNTVYAYDRDGDAIWWEDSHQRLTKFDGAVSVYDNNRYINHYHTDSIFNNDYNFSEWKAKTGQDNNSTLDTSPLKEGETEELFYNYTTVVKDFILNAKYRDLDGKTVSSPLQLDPFTSRILIKSNNTLTD